MYGWGEGAGQVAEAALAPPLIELSAITCLAGCFGCCRFISLCHAAVAAPALLTLPNRAICLGCITNFGLCFGCRERRRSRSREDRRRDDRERERERDRDRGDRDRRRDTDGDRRRDDGERRRRERSGSPHVDRKGDKRARQEEPMDEIAQANALRASLGLKPLK